MGVVRGGEGVGVGGVRDREPRGNELELLARAGPGIVAREVPDVDVPVVGFELPRLVVPLHGILARDPRPGVLPLQVRVRHAGRGVGPEAGKVGLPTAVEGLAVPVTCVVDQGIDTLRVLWGPGGREVARIEDVHEELFA